MDDAIAHTALLGKAKPETAKRASVASPSLPQPDVASVRTRKLLKRIRERRQRLARRSISERKYLLAWLEFPAGKIHDSGESDVICCPNLLQALQGRRTRSVITLLLRELTFFDCNVSFDVADTSSNGSLWCVEGEVTQILQFNIT